MSKSLKVESAEWIPSKDLRLIARPCEHFNRGRVYEILWEYCDLTADILKERQVCGWLYYENGKLSGVALGRRRQGALRIGEAFVFEEVWGPCDGVSSVLGQLSKRDMERVLEFDELVDLLDCESSIVLRAATDNPFALLIAEVTNAMWVNGLIIAERDLKKKVKFSIPSGYSLRTFKDGDEFCMSKIHKEAFMEVFHPIDYKAWATAANCHTFIATCNDEPAGFIIAEKRRCNSLGDFTIAVKPSHQGKGIGSVLLKAAFNAFIDVGVKRVIADYLMLNTSAHRLYQKQKFKPKRTYNYFLCKRRNLTKTCQESLSCTVFSE